MLLLLVSYMLTNILERDFIMLFFSMPSKESTTKAAKVTVKFLGLAAAAAAIGYGIGVLIKNHGDKVTSLFGNAADAASEQVVGG